jgi:anti-sigma B factor antagonist
LQNHFKTELHRDGGVAVLALWGELDLSSSAELDGQLERLDADRIIVDLRELEFIDSTGLGALVKAHQRAQAEGRFLGLVKGGAQVQRLLDLTGLSRRLTIADTPEELTTGD